MKELDVVDRGFEAFEDTLTFQREVAAQVQDGARDTLILVEHLPVYTSGRGAEFTRPAQEPFASTPWFETNRGGKVTWHGPGQLVVYPILNLERHSKDIHTYLRNLEAVVITALNAFGVVAYQRSGLTGIWVSEATPDSSFVGDSRACDELDVLDTREGSDRPWQENDFSWLKIASIGVGVKKWVTCHGLSLNVSNDLDYFRAISPCGADGRIMTSLKRHLAGDASPAAMPSMSDVKSRLVASFCEIFELQSALSEDGSKNTSVRRRPPWLKVKAGGSKEFELTRKVVRESSLVTVCEEARCPNMGECWHHRTATFMIMGELCTRRCGFCSVKDGTVDTLSPLDPFEPLRVGQATKKLGLKHVVITCVNRDDLPDMGALHFDQTVKAIRSQNPETRIELLISDLRGRKELLEMILASGEVSVLNHNVETVPRLYKSVRPGAKLDRSLAVLRWAKEILPNVRTKTGLMLGLGENEREVFELMELLRDNGVDILTMGQYLQPTPLQLPVYEFVSPEQFLKYERHAQRLGFSFVESGPLVRSSYHAWKHSDPHGKAPTFDYQGVIGQ